MLGRSQDQGNSPDAEEAQRQDCSAEEAFHGLAEEAFHGLDGDGPTQSSAVDGARISWRMRKVPLPRAWLYAFVLEV